MSNINPNNIDGTFPIAGQDNSSQGFRDNFTNIRNNFSYAQSELADLQAQAITTGGLSANGGTLNNNMAYTQLKYPQLLGPSFTYLNLGTPTASSTVTLDYSQSSVQKFTTNGNYTVAFLNWPAAGQYARLLLWINVTSTSHVITFPITNPGVTVGFSDLVGANAAAGTVTFDQTGNYLISFETVDNGSNIVAIDVNRNSATFRDPNFYFNDNIVNTLFVGFGTNSTVTGYAIGADAGRSTIVADGQFSSTSVGNLSLANIKYSTLDTGPLSGYNITSARGNLQTGTFTPVQSNDILGYINAVTLTGNGTPTIGNVFTQVARIDFHATGANLLGGLGGNIAMYTGQNGFGGNNAVVQALGIENDQSVKTFGNLITSNVFVPGSATTAGGVAGQITYDANYVYICIAPGNWKRAALSGGF